MVGMAGFEPTTTSPPARCATRLRYIPNFAIIMCDKGRGTFKTMVLKKAKKKKKLCKNLLYCTAQLKNVWLINTIYNWWERSKLELICSESRHRR